MNTVLNSFLSNSFISIAKDVLPVPTTNIFPIQIVLILKFFFLENSFVILIRYVINEKG